MKKLSEKEREKINIQEGNKVEEKLSKNDGKT